jgi:hypothetical protein
VELSRVQHADAPSSCKRVCGLKVGSFLSCLSCSAVCPAPPLVIQADVADVHRPHRRHAHLVGDARGGNFREQDDPAEGGSLMGRHARCVGVGVGISVATVFHYAHLFPSIHSTHPVPSIPFVVVSSSSSPHLLLHHSSHITVRDLVSSLTLCSEQEGQMKRSEIAALRRAADAEYARRSQAETQKA